MASSLREPPVPVQRPLSRLKFAQCFSAQRPLPPALEGTGCPTSPAQSSEHGSAPPSRFDALRSKLEGGRSCGIERPPMAATLKWGAGVLRPPFLRTRQQHTKLHDESHAHLLASTCSARGSAGYHRMDLPRSLFWLLDLAPTTAQMHETKPDWFSHLGFLGQPLPPRHPTTQLHSTKLALAPWVLHATTPVSILPWRADDAPARGLTRMVTELVSKSCSDDSCAVGDECSARAPQVDALQPPVFEVACLDLKRSNQTKELV